MWLLKNKYIGQVRGLLVLENDLLHFANHDKVKEVVVNLPTR